MSAARYASNLVARLILLVVIALVVAAFIAPLTGHAAVPQAAAAWQSTLTHEARAKFGPAAPVAVLAAQIHQESHWRTDARSHAGASGLTQFMPRTAKWIPEIAPALAPANPLDGRWAIRAQVVYMHYLLARIKGMRQPAEDGEPVPPIDACARWAYALRAYNGGLGHVQRDRAAAQRLGVNPDAWRAVGLVNGVPRRADAFAENAAYPVRILLVLTPQYVAAGWGLGVGCA